MEYMISKKNEWGPAYNCFPNNLEDTLCTYRNMCIIQEVRVFGLILTRLKIGLYDSDISCQVLVGDRLFGIGGGVP